MKVLLINGSPHEHGCTDVALNEAATALNDGGIETEIIWIGNKAIHGCIGCGTCRTTGQCAFTDDCVNEVAEKLDSADGIIVGSPVHYAAASGAITSFLDRIFYSAGRNLAYKPAAAVVSCRRGGASAAFDQLNKYFTINNMIVVGSQYWNQIHGNTAEEALLDLEGLQTMRVLGKNMAWILGCIEAGSTEGIFPEKEQKINTNFIR